MKDILGLMDGLQAEAARRKWESPASLRCRSPEPCAAGSPYSQRSRALSESNKAQAQARVGKSPISFALRALSKDKWSRHKSALTSVTLRN